MTKNEERLLKELKAARAAIQGMKARFNQFDDGFALGKAALSRANKVIKDYRQPIGLPVPATGS